MDPELLRQILENSEPAPQNANPNSTPHAPQATQEGAPTPDEEPGLEVDPEAAQNLMGSIQAGIEGARAGTQGASAGEIIGAAFGGPGLTRDGSEVTKEDRLLDGVATGGAIATGGMKAVFETKDFLFGDTPPEEQSAFRRSVEQLDADMKEASPILGGLSSGIGQFAVAMIGIGKLGKVAQAIPKVGEALTAGKTAVEGVKGGAVALESGKAALAGAIAFDPHEARLSNLLQDTPLANPITAWLAADPTDSAAWGRVKSAMESIGLDAAIIGSLKLGGTVWKKLRTGDTAGASRTITDFENRRKGELDGTSEVEPIGEGPDAIPSGDAGAEASPWQQDLLMYLLQKPRRQPVMCWKHKMASPEYAMMARPGFKRASRLIPVRVGVSLTS
ncbi:hypothetical protein RBU00_09775 [Rhizobium sp. AN63]|uniref:hypothetical protein n=1 Tax=Rhizobium sp. AN63 TaxID=3035210 RepID=UPI0027D3A77C|nr:hypothetical protein [Rhizobium sp. AN63]MDQ4406508.1 hypothetical protein [Rhizobium sp. AN63]